MKKVIFAIVAVAFVFSFSFAQAAKVTAKPKALAALAAPAAPAAPVAAAPAAPVTKSFTGKVDTVTVGDEVMGIQAGITLVADSGEKIAIMVPSGTPITVVDGSTIMLSGVQKDSKAVVEYAVTEVGGNKALSIKLQ